MATDSLGSLFTSLRRGYRAQKSKRSVYEPLWDEIDYYTGPMREEGSTSTTPETRGSGLQRKRDLWDLTGIECREKLSSSLFQGITPTAMRWFLATYRKSALNRDTEAKTWLDNESEDVWNDIQDSDFNVEISKFLQELTGPGNGFISMEALPPIIEEETDERTGKVKIKEAYAGVDFTHIPLREGFFERDRKGGIRRFWRRFTWSASEAMDFYEDKKLPIPDDIREAYEQSSDKVFEIVFSIYPRPDIVRQFEKKVRYPVVPEKRPWGCLWWREDTGEIIGEEGGYYEKPIFYSPWSTSAGSQWGHGPANVALPTIKFVNARLEAQRAAEEKAIDPPILVSERAALGDLVVNYRPGAATVVGDVNGVKELHTQARIDISAESIEADRAMIRRVFHSDELTLKDSPSMTAMEAQIRWELMNRLLGKSFMLIEESALEPIVITIMKIRNRMGAGDPMPKKVRAAGGVFNIDLMGPFARSQRTDEVAAIERGATFVGGLAAIWPEARFAMDPIKAIKLAFARLGVPAELIPTDQDIKKAIVAMQQQQAQMSQAAAAKDQAKANKDNADAQGGQQGPGMLGPAPGLTGAYPALPPNPRLSPNGAPV